jgi:hypothetical protein
MILAHISDLHIGQDHDGDGGARALDRAQRVIDYLNALPGEPDGGGELWRGHTSVPPFESDGVVDFGLPPAIAFHVLDDDRGLTTHFRSL